MTTQEMEAIEKANEKTEEKSIADIALMEKYREELLIHHEYHQKLVNTFDKHKFMAQWEHTIEMLEREIQQNTAEIEAAGKDLETIKQLNK